MLISVIITTYNSPNFLQRCINSFLDQADSHFEIIVADDGSTEETKLLINQEMKDVLVFHYLPILWYRHPIPNNIREYWYYERPDILEYMQTAYKDLNIQFLPENIIKELSTDATASLVGQITNLTDSLPTEIVSTKTIIHLDEFINNLF